MQFNIKVFLISLFLSLTILIGIGYLVSTFTNSSIFVKSENTTPPKLQEEPITDEDRKDLSIMCKKSARVNILLLATNNDLADLMMVVSYDPTRKLIDIISIPRDTYNKVSDNTSPEWLKLNATYKMKRSLGGAAGVKVQLEHILHIPINYYIHVDFKAVKEFVDSIGGVEVNVTKHMDYDDPYDTPPLHIDFLPGKHLLDGEDAVRYLRWRKNNNGYAEGDIQRIERQHKFIKDAIYKSIGIKLPTLIGSMMQYLKTDMAFKDMLHYAGTAVGMDTALIQTYRIPGESMKYKGLSFFVHNAIDTEKMMLAIYNRNETTAPIEKTITGLTQLDPNAIESETILPVD